MVIVENALSFGPTVSSRCGGFVFIFDFSQELAALNDTMHKADDDKKEKSRKKERTKALSYLNELMSSDVAGKEEPSPHHHPEDSPKASRGLKSKFETEIQEIERSDPNNWKISSTNRQRKMYSNLYTEFDKYKSGNRMDSIFESKLNHLSPGGNFISFVALLKKNKRRNKSMPKSAILSTPTDVAESHSSPADNMKHSVSEPVLTRSLAVTDTLPATVADKATRTVSFGDSKYMGAVGDSKYMGAASSTVNHRRTPLYTKLPKERLPLLFPLVAL
jgi:hypothetical protein